MSYASYKAPCLMYASYNERCLDIHLLYLQQRSLPDVRLLQRSLLDIRLLQQSLLRYLPPTPFTTLLVSISDSFYALASNFGSDSLADSIYASDDV